MPSAQHLNEKQAIIDEIKDKLDRANAALVIDYIGINVAQADAMRKKLREANVDYKVYKNTLVQRAIAGTDFEQLSAVLSGPSAFAFGFEDAIAPARVISGIIKDFKKMEFKAGIIDGTFYDAEGLKIIASLPTKDELIARFLGSIQSPLSKLVRTFKAIADAMEDGTLTMNPAAGDAGASVSPAADAADASVSPAADAAGASVSPAADAAGASVSPAADAADASDATAAKAKADTSTIPVGVAAADTAPAGAKAADPASAGAKAADTASAGATAAIPASADAKAADTTTASDK